MADIGLLPFARIALRVRKLGAQSIIPARRGKKTWRVHGVRAEMRRAFPHQLCGRRALFESVLSPLKRKLSARAAGRTLHTKLRHVLLLGRSFNPVRARHRHRLPRISAEPDNLQYHQALPLFFQFVTRKGVGSGANRRARVEVKRE